MKKSKRTLLIILVVVVALMLAVSSNASAKDNSDEDYVFGLCGSEPCTERVMSAEALEFYDVYYEDYEEYFQINPKKWEYDPIEIDGKKLTFKSSNEKVATVKRDSDTPNACCVKYKGKGSATITAKYDGNVIATMKVKVKNGTCIDPKKLKVKFKQSSYVDPGYYFWPECTVKYGNKTLRPMLDYQVIASNKPGMQTVSLFLQGEYYTEDMSDGGYPIYVSEKIKVIPKGTTIKEISSKSTSITLKWKKQSKNTTGYQIQYATKKNFSDKKTKWIENKKTTKAVIKSLKSGKKYYVRVRTYKTVKSKKYYSKWSKVKSIKTK
ncbi:MAG: fibronectin type III domain-containing protein [Lachnospiraceae bacterium]|nr:fibronectin type III domain-containing protein [Lachnospiraceae bacterium]